jgi:glucose dehydrogenase
MNRRVIICSCLCLCVCLLSAQADWPAYGHDPGGAHFSPLKQITAANVAKLRRAWTYHTGEPGPQFESSPIIVGGRLYVSTQKGRIVALQPETGKEIWSYDPKTPRPREHRGVAYWPGDAHTPPRVFSGTGDGRLIAIDAATGRAVSAFGDNGAVNLRTGVTEEFPRAGYAITSPPAIYRDLVIVGPSTQ